MKSAAAESSTPTIRRADGERLDPEGGPCLVTIHYFKPLSGKWMYTDEDVEWAPDPTHYTKWRDFRELQRLKDMTAVCILSPLGFPQSLPGDLTMWKDDKSKPVCTGSLVHSEFEVCPVHDRG